MPAAIRNTTYMYNAEGQLIWAVAGAWTYIYDGDGRRVQKSSASGSKLYWYGAGGEVLAETDSGGNLQNEYVFFGGQRIALKPNSQNQNNQQQQPPPPPPPKCSGDNQQNFSN